MFIETEGTPNPATLKFLPGRDVMGSATADFAAPRIRRTQSAGERGVRPARRRARVPRRRLHHRHQGRRRVVAGAEAAGARRDHGPFRRRAPGHRGLGRRPPTRTSSPEDAEIVAQIKELLDTRVRPAVAGDGGDIVFRGYRDGVVKLHMQGSCSGCPSSSRDAEARHREHAAPLRAGSGRGRAGRRLAFDLQGLPAGDRGPFEGAAALTVLRLGRVI